MMNSAEWWLKLLLRWFGGVSVIAVFPFIMPWRWMVAVHEWLGMGPLNHQPVVEYFGARDLGSVRHLRRLAAPNRTVYPTLCAGHYLSGDCYDGYRNHRRNARISRRHASVVDDR
jgi:hypothetical protein